METVQFSVDINASADTVWSTLWHDKTFRQWAGVIDPGTYMRGELREGNTVEFISEENGYGVTSLVEKCIANELLLLRHKADTQQAGTAARDDEWTGGEEKYELIESGGATTLTVTFDVPSDMKEYFASAYPKALDVVKKLAEEN